ncbi:MAG TPA: NAD(P)/FAD-dependent oxidoreductase [Gammaproteobacteria bacterium]
MHATASRPTGLYDVAVVGGGHNGLVCAAYLARANLRVAVLERHTHVGGAAVTEEFHPGFRNSMASYTVSLLQRRVIDELGLAAHGLTIVPRPLANFVPAREGKGLAFHRETARMQAAIAEHSRRDAERYPRFLAELGRVTRLFRTLLLEAPIDPRGGPREHLRALVRLPRLGALGVRGLETLWDLLAGSAGDWLDRWFDADPLKGGLGFDSIVGHFASPYHPGSGYLLLHHALGEVNGIEGAWGHALGGMGAISTALEAACKARGVEIFVECEAARIEARADGCEIDTPLGPVQARAVAAALHPQILFERLLGPELLPEGFRERIRGWRSESASLRANVALSELPDFTCAPGRDPAPHHGAGILITPGLDYLDNAYLDARRSGFSSAPVIELLIPSTIDPSLAPAGAHVASLFCQHFRRHLPDGMRWADAKQAALDRIIDTVTEYAPNFRRSIVAVQAYTPEELETRFGLVGGDIFHGALTLDQLYWARPAWGYAQYRTPVPRVYLCGSGAHPGGGVSGAPGYNAAHAILRDRAKSTWR